MTLRQHITEFFLFAAIWIFAQASYQVFRVLLGMEPTIDTFSASVYWGLVGSANLKFVQWYRTTLQVDPE